MVAVLIISKFICKHFSTVGLCIDTQLFGEEVADGAKLGPAGGPALNACASIVRENEKEQDKTIPMITEEILQILIRLRIGIDT